MLLFCFFKKIFLDEILSIEVAVWKVYYILGKNIAWEWSGDHFFLLGWSVCLAGPRRRIYTGSHPASAACWNRYKAPRILCSLLNNIQLFSRTWTSEWSGISYSRVHGPLRFMCAKASSHLAAHLLTKRFLLHCFSFFPVAYPSMTTTAAIVISIIVCIFLRWFLSIHFYFSW